MRCKYYVYIFYPSMFLACMHKKLFHLQTQKVSTSFINHNTVHYKESDVMFKIGHLVNDETSCK